MNNPFPDLILLYGELSQLQRFYATLGDSETDKKQIAKEKIEHVQNEIKRINNKEE